MARIRQPPGQSCHTLKPGSGVKKQSVARQYVAGNMRQYGQCTWVLESGIMGQLTKRRNMNKEALDRIADAIEEILKLVKKDMTDSKARITEQWDNDLAKQKLRDADDISGDLWK